MSQIVTLTVNPAVDRSLSIDHVTPNQKLRCEKERRDPGGGGINVSRAIHSVGGDTLAIYTCGGYMGGVYCSLVAREGFAGREIDIEGETREHIMVHETATGSIYRFQEPGPRLSEEEAEATLDAVATVDPAPDYLVLSGSLPDGVGDDFYAEAVRRADSQTRIVVDATVRWLKPALEEGVFLIKPNVRELSELIERPLEGEDEIVELSRELIDSGGVEVVVTSLGAGGAVVVCEDLAQRVPSPAVKVTSKVGAGDSMVGGIVFALDRGDSLLDAIRYGIAAGAAAVMTAMTGLGSRDDVERLYQKMGTQKAE